MFVELLYEALHSEFGVKVETDDPEFLRQKLYKLRKESALFTPLSFVISPFSSTELWIVKTKEETNDQGQ